MLKCVADLHNRINYLDETLQWIQHSSVVGEWQLISSDTKRLVARIKFSAEGTYHTSFLSYGREQEHDTFTTLDGSQQAMKFRRVCSILTEGVQRDSLQ